MSRAVKGVPAAGKITALGKEVDLDKLIVSLERFSEHLIEGARLIGEVSQFIVRASGKGQK